MTKKRELTANQKYKKEWYLKNRERLLAESKERYDTDKEFKEYRKKKAAEYRQRNQEKVKTSQKEYRSNNREKLNEYHRDFRKKNRPKVNHYSSLARASKRNACPHWLTREQKEEIKNFYWLAQDLRAVTGEEYHVDHIVPLRGENISGLHVPWNLQVLPSDLNLRKNKYV